jgi:hypothetical protein
VLRSGEERDREDLVRQDRLGLVEHLVASRCIRSELSFLQQR